MEMEMLEQTTAVSVQKSQKGSLLISTSSAYAIGVMMAGAALLAYAGVAWESNNLYRFLAYLASASAAGLMRIWTPDRKGSYSLASIYFLLAMAVCSFSELAVIGFVSVAVESGVMTGSRRDLLRVLFNASAMVVALTAAYYPAYLMLNPNLRVLLPLALTISSGLIYLAYTFQLCGLSYLKDKEPFFKTWDKWLMNTFGYHLLGSTVAIILSVDQRIDDWKLPLPVLPLSFVIFYYYRASLLRKQKI